MSTTHATLPRELVIDAVVHVQHWRTRNHVVLQNYTLPVQPSDNPLSGAPQITGQNWFHVYRVIQHDPGESLGDWLATFTDLQPAIDFVATQEQFA